MTDFQSLFGEKPFKFIVGSEQCEVYIHPSIVSPISEPLYKLMTNGCMEESLAHEARLPHVDPQTFAMFLEYAYTRSYTARTKDEAPIRNRIVPAFELPCHGLEEYYCRCCFDTYKTANAEEVFPFCNRQAKDKYELRGERLQLHSCAGCGSGIASGVSFNSSMAKLCQDCENTQRATVFHHTPKLAAKFASRCKSQNTYPESSKAAMLSDETATSHVSRHAKLHVFADMYLVSDLGESTLHKLYRDLYRLTPDHFSIREIVELLEYTFDNTPDQGLVEQLSGCWTLRSLVLDYAVAMASELTKYSEFGVLVVRGGALATSMIDALSRQAEEGKV